MVPDIIADARAAIFRATVGGLERTRIRLKPLTPILCGVMLCEWYVINANHIGCATQSLNDSHASVSKKDYTTLDEFIAAVSEKVAKRVEQLRSGNVSGTRAPASPAAKLGRQVASAAVEAG